MRAVDGVLGVDFIVHHIGFDERGLIKGLSPTRRAGRRGPRGVDPGAGGWRADDPAGDRVPARGAPLVVLGAPLVIDGAAFKPADRELFPVLQRICSEIRKVSVRV